MDRKSTFRRKTGTDSDIVRHLSLRRHHFRNVFSNHVKVSTSERKSFKKINETCDMVQAAE